MVDLTYMEFAETDRQKEVLSAVIKCGSNNKAAAQLGVGRRVVDKSISSIKQRYNESHGIIAPEGYVVSGTSTLRKTEDGMRWIKTSLDAKEQAELMQSVIDRMKEGVPQIAPELPLPKMCDSKLLNCFVITDYHLGMNAWGQETGADWDMGIAESLLVDWFVHAIQNAPKAKTAVFAQLGDFLHWDGMDAVTPMSGNILEGDTRIDKMVQVAIGVLMRVTQMLLQTHEKVHLVMAEGNHDPASSVWLRQMFNVMYRDEPRITVDTSPQPYYCYEHGKTSLFFHHGHKRKPANIDAVFAAKFRAEFGRTEHSYGHMGHLHSVKVIESNLMQIEQHRTLASPDSYATRGGWVSGRSAKVITYHDEHGQVGSLSISPKMVSA